MSMQRILETARKLGLPVIVTDIAGREPMVVMPLEQFEAMAGTNAPEPAPEPVRTPSPAFEERFVEDIPVIQAKKEPPLHAPAEPTPEEDLALEERFYIEPLDDAEGGV